VRDDHPLRHDSDKLATVLMRIFAQHRHARTPNGHVKAGHP